MNGLCNGIAMVQKGNGMLTDWVMEGQQIGK